MTDTRRQLSVPPAKTTGHQQQQQQLRGPSRRDGAVQFGAVWVLAGLASYIAVSLLARTTLHSPQALQQLQREVPAYVYDRSLFVFGTAFLLDVLGLLFELKSSRLDVVLLPAFVKGVATLTNALMRSGWATVAYSTGGRVVMVQRLVCWLHTTPTILVLVRMMATSITRQQAVRAVVCVEVMCVTGMVGSLTAGWWSVFWGGLSHLAFLPLLPYLCQGLTEASAVVSMHAARPTMACVYYLTMLMWTGFGLVWDLRMLDLIDTRAEEVAYLCCDFAAKVVFSAGLMLSSFKGLDSRREVVMRQIQEAHKQTLILELRRAIEQKDVFMSSVSHELRTPLNGIIGISEGLLANCCGPLSEGVRKQLFIVRTSGARLLALINDVMDAATLRQHRLVLKQERLDLRQVVGDVVDLTRSLVDADVSLRNDVPEGLVVWADSGRIIQILNNLLGNAAKFTHQGFIRVTAKLHDEQRQWVAVHVSDTGIGIPKQKLQSIFLPFEQVDGSISRQYGGFGLGLSITQELVKAHGGELWVKSREHKGSQFAFTIPSYTGQKPLTPQQQQALQLQLQSRRSMPAGGRALAGKLPGAEAAAAGGAAAEQLGLRPSSSRGALSLGSPAAAADTFEGGSSRGAPGSPADKPQQRRPSLLLSVLGAVGGTDLLPGTNSQLDSTAAAGNDPSSALPADLLDSCVGEEYATELPYDAAQLSALASSKPFTAAPAAEANNSNSGCLQRIGSSALGHTTGSMLSLAAAAVSGEVPPDIQAVPHRDQRPSQFACTGRYQVLSVDDDPVNQTVVQALLASTGYEVVCLYNGQQTLEYIDNAEVLPDLILLDMLMPDMSGPDVCRQLALRQPQLNVPIILVSALADESVVVTGLDSGADDYITKPFRRAEFLARIRGKLQLASAGEQQRQASVAATAAAGGAEQPVVMGVTDDEVNHILLEGMLQSQNYRYIKVSSGSAALQQLEASGSHPPHLVLLDAALPDTTGLEVLQALRQAYSQVALPVIMLTARHNEKAIVQALDAGANDYAVKPFRRSELLARIRMHLRSSQKAAAAVSPTPAEPANSASLSPAGDYDEERLSAELQSSLRLQQLSSVPLLVVRLSGVSEALAHATAEQACQLMGAIADCFDAMVEKYAVIKVEGSDTSLTVAAPPSLGSNPHSTRNSFQLPLLQLATPGNSTSSLPPLGTALEAAAAAAAAGSSTATAAAAAAAQHAGLTTAAGAGRPCRVLTSSLLQLLQMAQELQAHLGISSDPSNSNSSTGDSTPSHRAHGAVQPAGVPPSQQPLASSFAAPEVQAQQQDGAGAACSSRSRPHTPLVLLQRQAAGSRWWHGLLHVRMSLHVGPLAAGVVGRRRPRYRLLGPALQEARLACGQAPRDRTVATASAAQLLLSSGVQGLGLLRGAGGSGSTGGGAGQQQLWVLRAGGGGLLVVGQHLVAHGAGVSGGTDGVLSQAAAALLAAGAASSGGKSPAAGLLHMASSASSFEMTGLATSAPAGGGGGCTPAEQPVSSAAPAATYQSASQQQQQQGAPSTNAVLAPVQPVEGVLPPPLQLVDPALQHSQLLLLQELSQLAAQLGAAGGVAPAAPNMLGPQLPALAWGHSPAANGLLAPALGGVGVPAHSAAASADQNKPGATAGAVSNGAAVSGEVVSASLSLYDWQSSPERVSAQHAYDAGAPAVAAEGLGREAPCAPGRCAGACTAAPPASTGLGVVGLTGSGSHDAGVSGLQLGDAELQQMAMLHHELAMLQQQINAALAAGGGRVMPGLPLCFQQGLAPLLSLQPPQQQQAGAVEPGLASAGAPAQSAALPADAVTPSPADTRIDSRAGADVQEPGLAAVGSAGQSCVAASSTARSSAGSASTAGVEAVQQVPGGGRGRSRGQFLGLFGKRRAGHKPPQQTADRQQ